MKIPSVLLLSFAFFIFSCNKEDDDPLPPANYQAILPIDTTSTDTTAVSYAHLYISIQTFQNTNGQLVGALFNSSANYSNNIIYRSIFTPVDSVIKNIEFDSIPPGTYSFSCFHDVNSDNVLNQNIFGLPTEGYGFSNNPGLTFGPPPFSQIKFDVLPSDTLTFNVNLIYL
jgi:uncharacterized protein (DUF2141 family)